MDKKQAILIFLFVILFFLVLYLIFTSESAKVINIPAEQAKPDNAVLLETDYRLKAKEFFAVFENLIENNSFTEENIAELKNKLLNLKVPAKFKDLHIRFILALTKMENYFRQKDEREKSNSFQVADQLKADYGWLK